MAVVRRQLALDADAHFTLATEENQDLTSVFGTVLLSRLHFTLYSSVDALNAKRKYDVRVA